MPEADALAQFTTDPDFWSQEQGLALFLVVDRLDREAWKQIASPGSIRSNSFDGRDPGQEFLIAHDLVRLVLAPGEFQAQERNLFANRLELMNR